MGSLKAPETVTTADGRYLIGIIERDGECKIGVFRPCGACGGKGCEACSQQGYTKHLPASERSPELSLYVEGYLNWTRIANSVAKAVRNDVDLSVFPADVRRALAARLARFVLEGLQIVQGDALCDFYAERAFRDELNAVSKKKAAEKKEEAGG